MSPRSLMIIGLLALAAPAMALAAAAPPHPPIQAQRLAAPITIDGRLDEAVWSSGTPITAFYQAGPDQGEPSSQKSEVRVYYDDDALYVGARLWDSAPDSMIARLSRRDVSVPSDRFSVYLDPYHDKRSGYYFLINSAGTLFDGTLSNDGWEDTSWDGVWNAQAHRDSKGWTAEYRIPFSQLRFQNATPQVWGINFRRVILRRNEEAFVAYQPRDESGFVSRWPELVGLDGLHASRTVELLPYATSKGEFVNRVSGDPFHDGSRINGDIGFDLRTSIGSRMTLNGTVNPDFGQVEVDPASLNLSDVETFFQEKRPFFVEGSSNFRFGNEGASDYWNFNWPEPTFFYSRRIGRSPQGSLPGTPDPDNDVVYADVPIGTTILGAAKLTGKITPSTNFGTLHAITARERAKMWVNGIDSKAEVEPFAYYGVMRGLREFKDRKQGLGSMVSLVQRSFDRDDLSNELNQTSAVGALDGWTSFGPNRLWVLSGWAAGTHVRGTEHRMLALQQSSRRYYQRPDAGHVSLDPDATSLSGAGARVWLNKERGQWTTNSAFGVISPGFEMNDMGFQTRSDVTNGHVSVSRRFSTPGKYRQYLQLNGALFGATDLDGNFTNGGIFHSGSLEFRNRVSLEWWDTYNPPATSVRGTRGGPRMKLPGGFESGFYLDSDGTRTRFYSLNGNLYVKADGSQDWSISPYMEWKPVSNVLLSFGPGFNRSIEKSMYVETIEDPLATSTFGNRYVFANLDQTTISTNFRLSWAFTPTISLQTYVQPYLSAGTYTNYKALAQPNTREFVATVPSAPQDFNYKSLRGSAVFRYEYMPGSTLYLVWTQDRSDYVENGEFEFGRDAQRLFDRDGDNIYLAKVTYYLGL
ncbi:MAG: carbohydrate binding family 9 domain-containing protein [Candidatus Eisenbacteria bacterium]|uniref:Carbohydrate binding family 9 domain-containing protein n=1 Tax=Eiseniibacteriota bacterium TaxID=2212470 RepID=A0A849SKW4_UNCEI|nr:carbohydrate binding family 9 domain-containing protein [Candidatus Eisenbacteria bacterium]